MLTSNVWVDNEIYSRNIALCYDALCLDFVDDHLFSDIDVNTKLYLLDEEKETKGRKDSSILSIPALEDGLLD